MSPVSKHMSAITAVANLSLSSGPGVDLIINKEVKLVMHDMGFSVWYLSKYWKYNAKVSSHFQLPDINKWGLDVFSASKSIRDTRVLTCTTFKIFQQRKLLETFKIDQKTLLTFLMTIEDHYLKVNKSERLYTTALRWHNNTCWLHVIMFRLCRTTTTFTQLMWPSPPTCCCPAPPWPSASPRWRSWPPSSPALCTMSTTRASPTSTSSTQVTDGTTSFQIFFQIIISNIFSNHHFK